MTSMSSETVEEYTNCWFFSTKVKLSIKDPPPRHVFKTYKRLFWRYFVYDKICFFPLNSSMRLLKTLEMTVHLLHHWKFQILWKCKYFPLQKFNCCTQDVSYFTEVHSQCFVHWRLQVNHACSYILLQLQTSNWSHNKQNTFSNGGEL